jgi:hypothetical protein
MLALRLPRIIANSIVEAFYEVSIRPLLEVGQETNAVEVYRIDILPKLARLLSLAQTEDGEGASWFLQQLSAKAAATPTVPAIEDAEQSFINALRKNNWRTVQDIGLSLQAKEGTPELVRQFIKSSLVESLRYLANPALSKILLPVADRPLPPADWRAFLTSISTSHPHDAEAFLSSEQRPLLDTADSELIDSILSAVNQARVTASLPINCSLFSLKTWLAISIFRVVVSFPPTSACSPYGSEVEAVGRPQENRMSS